MPRPYDLPPMTALICFEAAARKLSFKEAAQELNVTPAAISQQVKGLEENLGRPLFRRQHRGVDLTETGAYLFVALQRGLEGISDAVRDVRGPSDSEDVIIAATTAVSAFWLTPKIAAFWRFQPEITVSQVVSDVPLPGSRVDLSIHYGAMTDGDARQHLLFQDHILAVGTPEYAAAHRIETAQDLAAAPLIHLAGEEAAWTSWAEWFAALGQPGPKGRRIAVNNHMISLQLARDGIGAALGWTGLIGPLLESGELVPLLPDRIVSPHAFYLETHSHASARARVFRDWLIQAVR